MSGAVDVGVGLAVSSRRRAGPRKAKGAVSDPVLMPVTMSNSGRVPVSVQPVRRPAPKAPLLPPPETDRNLRSSGLISGSIWRPL